MFKNNTHPFGSVSTSWVGAGGPRSPGAEPEDRAGKDPGPTQHSDRPDGLGVGLLGPWWRAAGPGGGGGAEDMAIQPLSGRGAAGVRAPLLLLSDVGSFEQRGDQVGPSGRLWR